MKIALIFIVVLVVLFYIYLAAKTGKFLKAVAITAFGGVALLAVTHIAGNFFGFYVPLNIYTIGFSGLTGAPGVTAILLSNFIF